MIARLPPRPIRWASGLLTALAGLQVLVGLLLLSHRQDVERVLAADAISPDQLRTQVNGIVLGGAVVHALSAVAHVWLSVWCSSRATMGSAGRDSRMRYQHRGRIDVLLRQSAVLLPAQWAAIASEQGISALVRVALVWLLWVPQSSRRFFALPSST